MDVTGIAWRKSSYNGSKAGPVPSRLAAPKSELYRAEREIFCPKVTPQEVLAIHNPRGRPSSESG